MLLTTSAEANPFGAARLFLGKENPGLPVYREIRADFDRDTIVVYQAYCPAIADAALAAGRFVPPFSLGRMTWIKPSFLWLMERSNWARTPNQERILAVRITRAGWDAALAKGVLTSFEPAVHGTIDAWRQAFAAAEVHVQWDPERSLHGTKLDYRAIQVGLSRRVIAEFVNEWIVELTDLTPTAKKIRGLCEQGDHARARRLLPRERVYVTGDETAQRLGMNAP